MRDRITHPEDAGRWRRGRLQRALDLVDDLPVIPEHTAVHDQVAAEQRRSCGQGMPGDHAAERVPQHDAVGQRPEGPVHPGHDVDRHGLQEAIGAAHLTELRRVRPRGGRRRGEFPVPSPMRDADHDQLGDARMCGQEPHGFRGVRQVAVAVQHVQDGIAPRADGVVRWQHDADGAGLLQHARWDHVLGGRGRRLSNTGRRGQQAGEYGRRERGGERRSQVTMACPEDAGTARVGKGRHGGLSCRRMHTRAHVSGHASAPCRLCCAGLARVARRKRSVSRCRRGNRARSTSTSSTPVAATRPCSCCPTARRCSSTPATAVRPSARRVACRSCPTRRARPASGSPGTSRACWRPSGHPPSTTRWCRTCTTTTWARSRNWRVTSRSASMLDRGWPEYDSAGIVATAGRGELPRVRACRPDAHGAFHCRPGRPDHAAAVACGVSGRPRAQHGGERTGLDRRRHRDAQSLSRELAGPARARSAERERVESGHPRELWRVRFLHGWRHSRPGASGDIGVARHRDARGPGGWSRRGRCRQSPRQSRFDQRVLRVHAPAAALDSAGVVV